jgi:uncharacterized RDD family membrane protein YckC
MTKNKLEKVDANWKFSIDDQVLKNIKNIRSEVKSREVENSSELLLDESALPENKTRSDLAKEFDTSYDEEDVFDLGNYVKRALAFVVDLVCIGTIFYLTNLIIPILNPSIHHLLELNQLNYPLIDKIMQKGLFLIISLMTLFFLLIIPTTFFNCSLGKKIFGLRLRGEAKYSLSISQVFYRELIIKPISVAIIAGFIMPFYSKKRQSLHDRLAQTFVIEN